MERKSGLIGLTFEYLDGLRPGTEFSGWDLTRAMNRKSGEQHFPDTYLRYVRMYRRDPQSNHIVCISRARSIYRVEVAA